MRWGDTRLYVYRMWSVSWHLCYCVTECVADRKEMWRIFITPVSLDCRCPPPGSVHSYSPSHFMTLTGCGRERGGGGREGETEYWESGNHLNEMSDLSGLLSRAQDGLGSLTLPTDQDHIVKPVGLSYFPFSITRSQTSSLGPTWSIERRERPFIVILR